MKKSQVSLIISILCLSLVFILGGCGSATITGEPALYTNSNESFSIELPTESEDAWIINEETDGDVLDMTDSNETVNIVIQCASKAELQQIVSGLDEYESFARDDAFIEYLDGADIKPYDVQAPDFATQTTAYSFSTDKTEGLVLFIESAKSYYTFLARTVEDGLSVNSKAIEDSILSLKEIK